MEECWPRTAEVTGARAGDGRCLPSRSGGAAAGSGCRWLRVPLAPGAAGSGYRRFRGGSNARHVFFHAKHCLIKYGAMTFMSKTGPSMCTLDVCAKH